MESGWSLRAWKSARAKKRVVAPAGAVSPSIYQDGFGTRWLAVDAESGDTMEILSFAPPFAESPEFAAAVGERVARLARVRHTLYARVRRLDRPADNALLLFSDRVAGWRLADALNQIERDNLPLDISAVLALMRQLIPAVALFSRHQRDAAIGTISPDRLILTPQSRLVVAEYVLAPGLEQMHSSRETLWRDVRVTIPHEASATRIPPTADVVSLGVDRNLAAPGPRAEERRVPALAARSARFGDREPRRRHAPAVARLPSVDRARAAVRREDGAAHAAGSAGRVRRDARERALVRDDADAAGSVHRAVGEGDRPAGCSSVGSAAGDRRSRACICRNAGAAAGDCGAVGGNRNGADRGASHAAKGRRALACTAA